MRGLLVRSFLCNVLEFVYFEAPSEPRKDFK